MGTVKKVNRFVVTRDAEGQGAFAEMASSAATAITPGILAAGTTKIASATGSIMDSKLETVAKVRIRVEMDQDKPTAATPAPASEAKEGEEGEEKALVETKAPPSPPREVIEIIQNDIPGLSFQEGQRVVISTTGTPGNVWPE